MTMAQTSDRISALAAKYAPLTPDRLRVITSDSHYREATAADIRAMAASLLRQDETKGLRGLVKRVLGR